MQNNEPGARIVLGKAVAVVYAETYVTRRQVGTLLPARTLPKRSTL